MSPGDEVICVVPNGGMSRWCVERFKHKVTFPDVGTKYVVRDTFTFTTRDGAVMSMVLLHGLKNPDVRYNLTLRREAGFKASAFRKIEKTATSSDMEVFLKDADPASEQWDNRRRVKVA